MKTKLNVYMAAIAVAALFGACKKQEIGILETGGFTDTSGALKTAASFPLGIAIDNNLYMNNAAYRAVVMKEANSVTFGNEMKYGSIVQSDGTYNFATADALVNATTGVGLAVFGHVLGWHSQQNGTYLKNFAGIVVPTVSELVTNPGFENGLTGWSVFNTNGATIAAGTVASEAHAGTGYMKVVNPTANPGSQWKVQVSSSSFATTVGKQYTISYWAKAAAPGGSIRISTGPSSAQYQGDQTIGTAWQQVTYTITASLSSTTFLFDMGQVANTYYIDDASVKEVTIAPSNDQISAKLDIALANWITAIVTRYKGKVKAWDVINELFSDDGNIRNNSNTTISNGDVVVWSNYMGRNYPLNAFNYAKAADPDALLFINDYNLEATSTVKLDSLISFVKELQVKGAKVDGIGTQMHMNINTSYSAIDRMFSKLAATGLKVRVSELDIRVNPSNKTGFKIQPTTWAFQADMYKYVVASYIRNVPAAQRYGITVWGVDDKTSWLYNNGADYPLLFDSAYAKKPAYAGFLQGLK